MSDFLTSLGQQALNVAGQYAGQAINQILPGTQASGVSINPPNTIVPAATVPVNVALPQQYQSPQYVQAVAPQPVIPQTYLPGAQPMQLVQQPQLLQQQQTGGTTTGTTAAETMDVVFEEDTFGAWASRNWGWLLATVGGVALLIWIASGGATTVIRRTRSTTGRRRKGAPPTTIVVENNITARGRVARTYTDPSRLRIVRV